IQYQLTYEHFGSAVVGECQAAERGIPGIPPLVVGDFGGADAVDLLLDGPDGGDGGDAVGAAGDFEGAGLGVACVPVSANLIGDAESGAQAVGDSASGPAAQDAGQNCQRGVVLILALAAEVAAGKVTLRS